jgi:hypothetical protein
MPKRNPHDDSSFRTWIARIAVNRYPMALPRPWPQRRVSSHIGGFASPARTPEIYGWNQEVAAIGGASENAYVTQ